ncbi:MFS transporter [Paraliomyxa miuraensis]|uniref:MFS transporter n=1 Tax=Paraliomyxa miuraensis TaxID=376150 RepID=UPI0022504EDB|nr:MFS transporter [Paraliomyxa miuraensis]MCX4242601.1 MFS transporter [Paraliomyxa miuraensis]
MPPASPPSEPPAPDSGRGIKGPWGWVTTTYFAEGFPYTIVNSAADALFTVMGMKLSTLGLTTVLHLPWNLKFLWGPFVDQFETKRRWLLATELVLCGLLLVLTLVGGVEAPLWLLAAIFMLVAILSATHDIAVDGFYLEGLDAKGQSRYVGYRAAAYRLAMLAVNGPLLVLADLQGWRVTWVVSLAVMMGLTAYHAWVLPRPETRQRPGGELLRMALRPRVIVGAIAIGALWQWGRTHGWGDAVAEAFAAIPGLGTMSLPGWIGLGLLLAVLLVLALLPQVRAWLSRHDSDYARAFVVFLEQPRVGGLLAFVLLFRTGESFLQKMRFPFLHRELDLSLTAYGFANGTVGLAATFVGTLLGGYLIARHGLRRWLWPFLLAQNVLNLLYAGLALWPEPSEIGLTTITTVVAVEHFGAGLGTAVFMVYLMRCCDPAHKAAHMALLTALASVGFTLAGVASGALTEALGYGPYFVLTFVATLPSMALALVVPHLDR